MRNNKQRGFTLVELLVVIAILAILATVSVVGYTSFIERADVSVDEQLAAQLNNFTIALKADSNGDYYGVEITPENVREITAYILKDGGLDELNPQSAKHGYDFYYNFSTGKYEVVKTDVATGAVSPLMRLLANAETSNDELDLNPATCFTAKDENGKPLYAYVATAGSDLADAITGFEKFVGKTDENADYDIDDFTAFCTLVDSLGYEGLSNLLDVSVFATNGGNFAVDANGDHVALFIHNDVNEMSNTKTGADGESVYLNVNNPLVTVSADKTYKFPEGVTFNANSLYINVLNSAKVVLDIDAENWNNVSAYFTGDNVTIKNNGKEYVLDSGYDVHFNSEHHTFLEFVGSTDFTLEGAEVDSKLDNFVYSDTETRSNVAIDINNFAVFANPVDANSTVIVKWEVAEGYTDYVHFDTELNKFVFDESPEGGVVVVKATPVVSIVNGEFTYGDANAKEYTLNVACVTDVEGAIEIDGNTYIPENEGTMTLLYSESKRTFDFIISPYDFSYSTTANQADSIVLDNGVEITSTSDMISYQNGKLVLADGVTADTFGTQTLTIKVAGFTGTLNVNLLDVSAITVPTVNNNITVLGNNHEKATLSLSQIFGTIPANAKLYIYKEHHDSYNYDLSQRDTSPTIIENVTDEKVLSEINEMKTVGKYCLVLVNANGDRISDDFDIEVVTGYNIDDWTDITGEWQVTNGSWGSKNYSLKTAALVPADKTKGVVAMHGLDRIYLRRMTLTNSVVFLNNITMAKTDTDNYDTLIVSGATVYGNGFTFDLLRGAFMDSEDATENGVIALSNATLKDLKIVGQEYPDFAATVSAEYGTAVVVSQSSTTNTIENCYIANCRAGLRANKSSITNVKDTVFYGGRYANIDMVGGTINLKGTVITDNRYTTVSNKGVMGTGVAGWFNPDDPMTLILEKFASFKQYNFVKNDSTTMSALPTITIALTNFNFNPSQAFEEMFSKDDEDNYRYGDYIFLDKDGKAYTNAGAIAIDKYYIPRDTANGESYYVDNYTGEERPLALTVNGLAENNYINTLYILDYGQDNYSGSDWTKSYLNGKGIYTHKLPIDIWTVSSNDEASQKLFEEYLATLDGGEYEDYYGTDYEFVNGRVHFFTLP